MNVNDIVDCCGCTACVHTCPVKCIKMEQDEFGFYKSVIESKSCIDCGRCFNVCPMNGEALKNDSVERECFAAVSSNKEYYERSASGGIFSTVAEYFLKNNGVVVGCGINHELVPVHMDCYNLKNLDSLRRSKYVQSDLGDIFALIKSKLKAKNLVLFVGTPCQVAGLKKFIGENELLTTIDLICHGVPSYGMYKKNIEYIEKKRKKKINSYEFRLKNKYSKNLYMYTYIYTDGTMEVGPYYKDAYFNAFYDTVSLNECCYSCPYANLNRVGDFTIGDYDWGRKHHTELQCYDEISCIIVNSFKGKVLLNKIKNKMIINPTHLDWILEKNANLIRPTPRPRQRDEIYTYIQKNGYEKFANRYFHSINYYKKIPVLKPLFNVMRAVKK